MKTRSSFPSPSIFIRGPFRARRHHRAPPAPRPRCRRGSRRRGGTSEPRAGGSGALYAKVARALLGGTVDRRVRPIIGVSFTYSVSFSTFWVYVGIYAVKGLHWPPSRVGYLFLVSAPVAAAANYLSGRLAD